MGVNEFLTELHQNIIELDFVDQFNIVQQDEVILKVKISLKPKGILNVWYNAITRNQTFCILINDNRIWAIDYNKRFGWHEHPFGNEKAHLALNEQTIQTIVVKLRNVWQLNNGNK